MTDPAADGDAAALVASTRRVRLTVAYDGAGYRGFARNPGVRTVLGDLADAVATIVRRPVELTGAGRTDAGVHAWGQVVSGDLPAQTDLPNLARRINKLCAPGIAVRDAAWADDGFDARFSATYRQYRYDVWNDVAPNPLLVGRAWFVPQPLSRWAMRAACDPLIGQHDFASFCRRPPPRTGPDGEEVEASLVRRVLSARWTELDDPHHLRFEIRATAFCHQMVRSIVGTLVDVGIGRVSPGDVRGILVARSRDTAGQVAPAHGLVLWEVGYAPAANRSSASEA